MQQKLQYATGLSNAARDAAMRKRIRRVLVLIGAIPAALIVIAFIVVAYANVETTKLIVVNNSSAPINDAALTCLFSGQLMSVGTVPCGETRDGKFTYKTEEYPAEFSFKRAGQTLHCTLQGNMAFDGNNYTVTVTDRDVSILCVKKWDGTRSTRIQSPTTQ